MMRELHVSEYDSKTFAELYYDLHLSVVSLQSPCVRMPHTLLAEHRVTYSVARWLGFTVEFLQVITYRSRRKEGIIGEPRWSRYTPSVRTRKWVSRLVNCSAI